MAQLFFKKRYQDAIRDGRKLTTIRRWGKARVKVGGRAFSPGLGWLVIESVEPIELDALVDADAVADGFENTAHMREGLATIYPEHQSDGKRWFRVRFRVDVLQPRKGADAGPLLF